MEKCDLINHIVAQYNKLIMILSFTETFIYTYTTKGKKISSFFSYVGECCKKNT